MDKDREWVELLSSAVAVTAFVILAVWLVRGGC
jgi:hypothetical protein